MGFWGFEGSGASKRERRGVGIFVIFVGGKFWKRKGGLDSVGHRALGWGDGRWMKE